MRGALDVVIVNHNTSELLTDCLTSLMTGGLDGLTATIRVVDNASTDGSAAAVRTNFPDVRVIESGGNPGFAAANNLALAEAGHSRGGPAPVERDGRARHALLLNPDTLVPAGALAALVDALEREPALGAVGPKLLLQDGSLDVACRRSFPTPEVAFYRFSGLARRFPKSPRFGRYNMTFLDPDQPADVDSVVGACMLVRGAALAEVGVLDERFWMYGEDLDWALRLRRAGWRVGYRPQAVIHHVKRASSRSSDKAQHEFQRAMWLFYDKHYRAETSSWIDFLVRLGLGLKGGRRLRREMRLGNGARSGAEVGRGLESESEQGVGGSLESETGQGLSPGLVSRRGGGE